MRLHLYNKGFNFVKPPVEFNKNTKREILQYCLGATLYMPGTKDIKDKIVHHQLDVTSFVMCCEDAIKELKAMLNEMKANGTTIIISTHMLESVEDIWDKVFIMMNGRIEAERTRKFVEESGENLEELFFNITEKKQTGADHK